MSKDIRYQTLNDILTKLIEDEQRREKALEDENYQDLEDLLSIFKQSGKKTIAPIVHARMVYFTKGRLTAYQNLQESLEIEFQPKDIIEEAQQRGTYVYLGGREDIRTVVNSEDELDLTERYYIVQEPQDFPLQSFLTAGEVLDYLTFVE